MGWVNNEIYSLLLTLCVWFADARDAAQTDHIFYKNDQMLNAFLLSMTPFDLNSHDIMLIHFIAFHLFLAQWLEYFPFSKHYGVPDAFSNHYRV